MQKTGWTNPSFFLVMQTSHCDGLIWSGFFLWLWSLWHFGMVTNNQLTNQPTNQVILEQASCWPVWEGSLLQLQRIQSYIKMWIRSSWYGILIDPRWPVPGNCDSPCYWFPRSDHFQPCSPPVIDSLTHFDSSVMQIQQQCWDGCRRHKWSVLSGRYWFHLIISPTTAHSRINYFRRSNPRAH